VEGVSEMSRITDAWQRISKWYDKHAGERILNEGAHEDDLCNLERDMQLCFPEEFKETYRLHNGSKRCRGLFLDGSSLLSLKGVHEAWTGLCDIHGEEEEDEETLAGPDKDMSWNKKWIPITDNGGGDHNCIDLDPGRGGKEGQVIDYSHEEGALRVVAGSLSEWLTELADLLDKGAYEYCDYQLVPVRSQNVIKGKHLS